MTNRLLNRGLGVFGSWELGLKSGAAVLRSAFLLLLASVLPVLNAAAQSAAADTPEMADALRQDGKIYVVVAVITVLLAGLLALLIALDRKVTRLEKSINNE
ncbi:hypothetical protein SAMN02745146_0328 [Hymenobacter daecheongensis DSM 21074]|uniref:CcmD family protein n=1 Tax=Hymenobacter daecheongensis DSM 21074 TaxID=1121955 RepID=A0A1M6MLI6_9BACT|nr:hypothetical protein SAMN02745146_0328 [Hymenobacter daecheongensis DSM 21074]